MGWHRRLATRLLLPIVGFTLVFGSAVFAFVAYATYRFVDEQAESSLRWRAYALRQIIDDQEDELQRTGQAGNASARRDRKVNAMVAVEDFARANGLRVAIRDETAQRVSAFGELPVAVPPDDGGNLDRIARFHANGHRYHALSFTFEPWQWRITVVEDNARYVVLRSELTRAAWVAGGALTGATFLFMLFLGAITRKPIDAIVGKLQAGQAPHYRGVAEFEYMSDSIGEMMRALQEKSAVVERYRDQLEVLVAERTAELSQANEALRESNRELETTHQQLLHSEKMASVGQLAAGVAHEINNPIGFVNSNLGSLADYLRDLLRLLDVYEQNAVPNPADAAAADVIETTRREIDIDFIKGDVNALLAESCDGLERVKRIVQDLKEFSHVGGADWQRADLHRNLDSTINVVWNELKYKVRLVKNYGELPEVECLPSEISQVFMNMLVNAGHAIDKNGVITISTGTEGDQVWVEFADTGRGIAAEHLPRIFDPFFTTKPVGQGTGLGLSLSYGIVRKHNGRIDVDSEPGRGTTFRIWLPIDQPRAETNGH